MLLKACILLGLVCLAWAGNNKGDWTILNTQGNAPGPRTTITARAFGNNIFTFGGFLENLESNSTEPNVFYNDVYRFKTSNKRWTKMDPQPDPEHGFPPPRAFAISGVDGKDMVVGFGINYTPDFSQVEVFNDLWAYSTNKNKWKLLRANNSPLPGPGPRAQSAAEMLDGKLYLYGGINGYFGSEEDTWVYDMDTDTWTEVVNAVHPSPRYGTAHALDEDYNRMWMYSGERTVFEGYNVNFEYAQPDAFWYLDLDTLEWHEVTPHASMPDRNNGNGAVWYDGLFFLFGGDIGGGPECPNVIFRQNNLDETWIFNSHTQSFNQICTDTVPLNFKRATSVLVNKKVYMFGGLAFQVDTFPCGPFIFNDKVWAYEFDKSCEGGPMCNDLSPE